LNDMASMCAWGHVVLPPHFARSVCNGFHNNFVGGWTGRGGPIAWSPSSPALTPLHTN
jgi:hypothetical protein